MTNTISKDGSEEARVAAVAAVNIVKQVLDDAFVIANIVRETGQPWRYLSLIKSLHYGKFLEMENRHIFLDSKIDEESIEELIVADAMSTSEKYSGKIKDDKENNEDLIGQGDTNIELDDSNTERDLKSPTILINNLFDMSDVERELDKVQIEDNTDVGAKIMEYCVDDALNIATIENVEMKEEVKDKSPSSSISFSTYSFLAEAAVDDVEIDEANTSNKALLDESYDNVLPCSSKSKITEEKQMGADKTKNVFCEKAFLSLNRDDEQDSDQDEQDIKQDLNNIAAFQDVQLIPPSGSGDNLKKTIQNKEDISNDIPSSTGRYKKTTLARRCRIHGARMLACLRGWWMRRSMSKRQMYHAPKIRSPCPASPRSRKRAMSLLNKRKVDGGTPDHCVLWKFNTVNESLVDSKRWKDEFNAEITDDLL